MNDTQLADKLEDWLAAHMDPIRTTSGDVSRSGGLVRYQDDDMQLLLGGINPDALTEFRRGRPVAYIVKRAVAELVDAWDVDAIRELRRDQALVVELRSGIDHGRRFGHAPDGGPLGRWAARVRQRLDATYQTEARPVGEALALWDEIFPSVNRRRRERYAA